MSGTAFRTGLCARTDFGPWPWGVATVYALVPPLWHVRGVSEYVIVAADLKAHKVDIHACDEDGFIADWEPISELRASVDAEHALRELGYGVVVLDDVA